MDKLILGLLLLKGRTIYELRDRIAEGMEMMYSASIGSIQAAIKKSSSSFGSWGAFNHAFNPF